MFTLPDEKSVLYIEGEYSISIVILSVVIAIFASYTALSMNERMKYNSFFPKYIWLILASITMGFGIWSMHFIGMSALMLPVPMELNSSLTILSILPAVAASFLAFYITSIANTSTLNIVLSGIVMGLGISTMHYIGMMAMEMNVKYAYNINLFMLSIIIAIMVSFVSLYIFSTIQRYMNNFIIKWTTAIIMGLAISSMHYIGMFAVQYYVESPEILVNQHHMHNVNMNLLMIGVTVGITIIFLISCFSSLLDRYVDYRLNYFDALTRLPNRRNFEKVLHSATGLHGLAIFHIHDLENWNNTFGYQFGDNIIQYIEKLASKLKPANVALYRIEGNRLAFLSFHKKEYNDTIIAMNQLSAILSKPVTINDQLINIKTVCSLAEIRLKGDEGSLYEFATAVLNHHSIVYENQVISYDPMIHVQSFQHHLVQDIEAAMQEHQLYLVYQPKVEVPTKRCVGVEALLRWDHPTYGQLSPGIFIPVLESADKMFDVTDWIINEVCKQIKKWEQQGELIQVAVNIPGPYVTSPRLMEYVKQSTIKYGISPSLIELEMTETSAVENIEGAIQAVHAFRDYGFSVALDDFGTGVSSLSYLKRLPVSTLKIDKSFVDGVPDSQKDSEIMKAIIVLGNSLHLNIIIEGVETKKQVDFLTTMEGCKVIQGYYMAKPMKIEELEEWWKEHMVETVPN